MLQEPGSQAPARCCRGTAEGFSAALLTGLEAALLTGLEKDLLRPSSTTSISWWGSRPGPDRHRSRRHRSFCPTVESTFADHTAAPYHPWCGPHAVSR